MSHLHLAAENGEAVCECGHPASDHAEGYVCTHKLSDENEGWYGVCPCVRYDEDFQPDRLPAAERGTDA